MTPEHIAGVPAADPDLGAGNVRGQLPPTHKLDDPAPACAPDRVRKQPRTAVVDHVTSNSFGLDGHNVSLGFGRAGTRFRRAD